MGEIEWLDNVVCQLSKGNSLATGINKLNLPTILLRKCCQ